MPSNNPLPATDSAKELRPILGDDATATFEDDANFVDSNPAADGSSENVEEQKSAAAPGPIFARDTDDTEEDDEDDLEDDDEDDDEEDEDEDDLDEGEEDDEDEDDIEEDEDEEDEDDEDEVKASSVYRVDGLLGDEDEADDAKEGVDRKKGDAERAEEEVELNDGEKNYDPNSHTDGKWEPIENDGLPEEEGMLVVDKNDAPDPVPPYRAALFTAQLGA